MDIWLQLALLEIKDLINRKLQYKSNHQIETLKKELIAWIETL